MSLLSARVFTPLFFLCTSLGCSSLWKPFSYSEPNNCAPNPAICGAGLECNFQTEVCEPSPTLPTSSRPLWRQQAKLTASDGAALDALGYSVSVFGDTVVVGSHLASVTGVGTTDGAAYVFVRDPDRSTWTQQAKLTASDAATGDNLGVSVSVFGDTALLSAHESDPGGLAQAGAAYVFVRRTSEGQTIWTQQAKLVASDRVAGDRLGSSVSLYGDTALLGAHLADPGVATDSGAAYVFLRNPATGVWAQQGPRLVPSDAADGDLFGRAVSLSADTTLIGALQADPGGKSDAGAAYVFARNPQSGAWSQQAKLVADDGAAGDGFGYTVAVSGDTAVVGAPGADPGGKSDAGAAYVFARNPQSGAWSQQAKLVASDGVLGAAFGSAAALSGDRIAITAAAAAVNGQAAAGAVYVFTRTPGQGSWVPEARLGADDAALNDRAGYGVALSGDTLALGASGKDRSVDPDVGAAYIFQRAKPNGDPCGSGRECHSTFCADGVCCDSACGGSDPSDCQACSAAAGAPISTDGDGTCRPRRAGKLCRPSVDAADPPELCDGQLLTCPADIRG